MGAQVAQHRLFMQTKRLQEGVVPQIGLPKCLRDFARRANQAVMLAAKPTQDGVHAAYVGRRAGYSRRGTRCRCQFAFA